MFFFPEVEKGQRKTKNSPPALVVLLIARFSSFLRLSLSLNLTHLSRDVQLLLGCQRGPGALLSVPQGRVEDADVVGVGDAAGDVLGAREAFGDGRRQLFGRRRRGSDDDAAAAESCRRLPSAPAACCARAAGSCSRRARGQAGSDWSRAARASYQRHRRRRRRRRAASQATAGGRGRGDVHLFLGAAGVAGVTFFFPEERATERERATRETEKAREHACGSFFCFLRRNCERRNTPEKRKGIRSSPRRRRRRTGEKRGRVSLPPFVRLDRIPGAERSFSRFFTCDATFAARNWGKKGTAE